MNPSFSIRASIGALVFAFGASAHAVSTVGTYAPNPNALPLTDAVSNTALNGITLASFQTLTSAAFTANRGGVIDFEAATGWTNLNANIVSVDATYGASQASTLTFARTDAGNGFNANNNNGTNVISGSQYMGMQAVNGVFTFSKGLSAFGLTMVSRGTPRRTTLTFTLDDASTISTSQETTNLTNAVFFGMAAPTGRTITGVTFAEPDGFTRYDDLGFVVAAPVPEPSALAALALGGLAVLRKRRK